MPKTGPKYRFLRGTPQRRPHHAGTRYRADRTLHRRCCGRPLPRQAGYFRISNGVAAGSDQAAFSLQHAGCHQVDDPGQNPDDSVWMVNALSRYLRMSINKGEASYRCPTSWILPAPTSVSCKNASPISLRWSMIWIRLQWNA